MSGSHHFWQRSPGVRGTFLDSWIWGMFPKMTKHFSLNQCVQWENPCFGAPPTFRNTYISQKNQHTINIKLLFIEH